MSYENKCKNHTYLIKSPDGVHNTGENQLSEKIILAINYVVRLYTRLKNKYHIVGRIKNKYHIVGK